MAALKANTYGLSNHSSTAHPASSMNTIKPSPCKAGPSTTVPPSHARRRHKKPPIPTIVTHQSPHLPGRRYQKKGINGADIEPPPISPITPPLAPLKSTTPIPPPTIPPNFASMAGRAPLTHVSHPANVSAAPAPPVFVETIDFENNTDVIAVQATIGILLQQKKRAQEDIRTLRAAKAAALARPMEFLSVLSGENVKQTGVDQDTTSQQQEHEDITDEEGVEGRDGGLQHDDVEMINGQNRLSATATSGVSDVKRSTTNGYAAVQGKGKGNASVLSSKAAPPAVSPSQPKAWVNLPTKQSVVRLPPINWAQYAVEGEALNRIHHEQTTSPARGMPAVIGASGSYKFTGATNPDDGKKVDGLSAPYDAFKDQIGNKTNNTSPSKKAGLGTKAGGSYRRGGA